MEINEQCVGLDSALITYSFLCVSLLCLLGRRLVHNGRRERMQYFFPFVKRGALSQRPSSKDSIFISSIYIAR